MTDNLHKWNLPEFGLGSHAHHNTNKNLKIQVAELSAPPSTSTMPLYQPGFDQGYADGLQVAKREMQQPLQRLQDLVNHLQSEAQILSEEREKAIMTFVKALCENVFHKEMTLSQDSVLKVITQALKMIEETGKEIRISCHPKLHVMLHDVKFDSHSRIVLEENKQLMDLEFKIETEKQKICFNGQQVIEKLFDEILTCNSQQ